MKVPPHNAEAEMAALGSMVLSKQAAQLVSSALSPDDFYVPAHRTVFVAARMLMEAGSEIDLVTLRNILAERNELAGIGNVEYLVQLAESVPTVANAGFYAEIVADKAARRRMFDLCKSVAAGIDNGTPTSELLATGYQWFTSAATEGAGRGGAWVNQDELSAKMFLARKADMKSQFAVINRATQTGYRRGEVYGLVAGTGGGKSAYLMQEVLGLTVPWSKESPGRVATDEEVAAEQFEVRANVALISLELSGETLVNRAVQNMTGQPDSWRAEAKGPYIHQGWLRAHRSFLARNIAVYDSSQMRGMDWVRIEKELRSLASKRPLDFVAIDYLQLLELSSNKRATKYDQLKEITEQMKTLAVQLDVAIMFVSQLTLEREAGDLVDRLRCRGCPDAANPLAGLWALTKPKEPELAQNRRVMTVVKSRFGPSGFASDLYWDAERLMLTDMGAGV